MGEKLYKARVIAVLSGDIERDPIAFSKYGYFLDEVGKQFSLVNTIDAKIPDSFRAVNAILSFRLNRTLWKEAFRKNNLAFRMRSKRVGKLLESMDNSPDVILQIGALFDSRWTPSIPPSVIYTDYTTKIGYDRKSAGRSPFTARTLKKWMILEKQAYDRASFICTRSEKVKISMIQDYGIPLNKIEVVGGGVNFKELPDISQKKKSQNSTVLFIGQNFYRKGGDLVVKAFAKVKAEIPNAKLLLLSKGPIPEALPLDGVQVFPYAWDREMVSNLYRQADVFILPSRLETWGDVILEAMSYGLPCIGVLGEPMDEIIEHEKTGLLVKPDNVEGLTKAMTQLLGDEEKHILYGRNARQRVEQQFTWKHTVDLIAPILEQVSKQTPL